MSTSAATDSRVFAGRIFDVYVEQHPAGVREIVRKPGAVAIVAWDDEGFFLVTQPREAVGEERFEELPAGLLDRPDEEPLDAARRELEEECGLLADEWHEIGSFYASPGFTDEKIWLFGATRLRACSTVPDVSAQKILLSALDEALVRSEDAKTIIGLNWLAEHTGLRDF